MPARAGVDFNVGVAASAAIPAMMLANEAHATYGVEVVKWYAILVPATTLVFAGVFFGAFFLYSFSEDFFYGLIPGSKKSKQLVARWREHPYTANIKDPLNGLIDKDDFERGLEVAWDKAKPAGSKVTVQSKLKEFSEQNSPHSMTNDEWVSEFPGLPDKVLGPA